MRGREYPIGDCHLVPGSHHDQQTVAARQRLGHSGSVGAVRHATAANIWLERDFVSNLPSVSSSRVPMARNRASGAAIVRSDAQASSAELSLSTAECNWPSSWTNHSRRCETTLRQAQEHPILVQELVAELAVEAFNERLLRQLAR